VKPEKRKPILLAAMPGIAEWFAKNPPADAR